MTLHLRHWHETDTPGVRTTLGAVTRLVLLHGFTQNVECWGSFLQELARRIPVTALDAPGHGLTDSSHDRVDLWQAAELINESIRGANDRPVVVGYSMGGRMALHLALRYPETMAGLVLIGATPGIADNNDRHLRWQADQDLAARIRQQPLQEFLDRWLSLPLFAGLDDDAAATSARLTNRRQGLAHSLECCGTGSQESLWDRLHELSIPVLLITGSGDLKFSALAQQMLETMTGADVTLAEIEGTHAVHLERPVESAARILRWLETVG